MKVMDGRGAFVNRWMSEIVANISGINKSHADLSMPVSSFTSICSITSFFLCRHSANFGDELRDAEAKKVKTVKMTTVFGVLGLTLLEASAGR